MLCCGSASLIVPPYRSEADAAEGGANEVSGYPRCLGHYEQNMRKKVLTRLGLKDYIVLRKAKSNLTKDDTAGAGPDRKRRKQAHLAQGSGQRISVRFGAKSPRNHKSYCGTVLECFLNSFPYLLRKSGLDIQE